MARSMLGEKDEQRGSAKNHPVESNHLLALIRGQHLDNETFVRQHLAECARCKQSYAELWQTSRTLDVLGQMARYQCYPELSSAQTLVKVRQSASRQHASPYRLPLRGVSLPAMILLIIMGIVIMVAWALMQIGIMANPWNQPKLQSYVITSPTSQSGIVGHGLSPTPYPTRTTSEESGATETAVATALSGVTAVPSPTATMPSRPHILSCSQRMYYVSICGYGFTPGDIVTLKVFYQGQQPGSFFARVRSSGFFQVEIDTYSCARMPFAAYAADTMSNPPVYSNSLMYLYAPGCPGSS